MKKSNVVDIGSASRSKLNDEVDELFKLPWAEFTDARNALAKRLKQSGRANDANLVKTLTKPSVSAWTVNQLYWNHRDEFETLLAAGRRVREAQVSGAASRLAEMRAALDARHKALVELSDLAASLLRDSGSNPSLETIRRITTTLEAISALADGPSLGRLTQDVDPPGFESLASFMAGTGTVKAPAKAARAKGAESAGSAGLTLPQKAAAVREAERLEQRLDLRVAPQPAEHFGIGARISVGNYARRRKQLAPIPDEPPKRRDVATSTSSFELDNPGCRNALRLRGRAR